MMPWLGRCMLCRRKLLCEVPGALEISAGVTAPGVTAPAQKRRESKSFFAMILTPPPMKGKLWSFVRFALRFFDEGVRRNNQLNAIRFGFRL